MLPEFFDIRNQVPSRVFAQLGVGRAFPAAALVEKDHAPFPRIEKAGENGLNPIPRASMEIDDGLALGISAFLEMNGVQI
jgi:hypothetical protein